MGIFDGIALLSDMDGTLLNGGILSREHVQALEYFTQNGGLFVPATGRAEDFLLQNYPELPLNSYCIVRNGTTIYDIERGSLIWKRTLPPHVIDRICEIVKNMILLCVSIFMWMVKCCVFPQTIPI